MVYMFTITIVQRPIIFTRYKYAARFTATIPHTVMYEYTKLIVPKSGGQCNCQYLLQTCAPNNIPLQTWLFLIVFCYCIIPVLTAKNYYSVLPLPVCTTTATATLHDITWQWDHFIKPVLTWRTGLDIWMFSIPTLALFRNGFVIPHSRLTANKENRSSIPTISSWKKKWVND